MEAAAKIVYEIPESFFQEIKELRSEISKLTELLPQHQSKEQRKFTVQESANYFGVTRITIGSWIKTKKIPPSCYLRLGRRIYVLIDKLLELKSFSK